MTRYKRIRIHYHFASGYRGYLPDVSESFKDQQEAREYFNHFVEETIDTAYQSSDSEGRHFASNTEMNTKIKELQNINNKRANDPSSKDVEL